MSSEDFRLDYPACQDRLAKRLAEPAPGRIQLLTGPRQVGKTTLAHAWNSGQSVSCWREEPIEVDGILEGSWGQWAVEVKTGRFQQSDLVGLLEFVRRHPGFRPLVICNEQGRAVAERASLSAITWQPFLLDGPPRD